MPDRRQVDHVDVARGLTRGPHLARVLGVTEAECFVD